MNIEHYSIDWKRYGQAQPYQDSYYEAVISFPNPVRVERAKQVASILVRPFIEPPKNWASTRLEWIKSVDSLNKFGASLNWHVLIKEPFTD